MIKVYTYVPKGYFGSNTYLIASGDEYAVVDPSVNYSRVLEGHPEIKDKVKYVLLTHAHFDHIIEINSWSEIAEQVIVGRGDEKMLADSYLNCYLGFLGIEDGYFGPYTVVGDEDKLYLGDAEIRVISTPGHTPGGVCYRVEEHIFVGDTIFSGGGYGRCDLPGGDIDTLEKSIIKIITKENDGIVHPGHGDKSKLSEIITYFM